ncbi:MAG: hypothetical protein WC421_07300 [Elusimicrobiales bacterium]
MKLAFAFTATALLSAVPAFAHPPSAIHISITGKQVNVTVDHNTRNRLKHYIDKIAVSLDGKTLVSQNFALQQDEKTQTAVYLLPELKSGAVVRVYAECNMKGSLAAEQKAP